MSIDYDYVWGAEFANPWHDEEGKFAPKGTGKQSGAGTPNQPTGGQPAAPATTGVPDQAKLAGAGQGGRTSGADTEALAQDVIDGMRFDENTQTWVADKSITIDPVDADDVIKQFADAPVDVVDLTAVTVNGAPNMFSQMRENGRPRDQMPQITPDVQAEWWKTLDGDGIAYEQTTIDPATLAATQSELNGKKVGGMINAMQSGKMSLEGDPLLVSNDGHILDGHHRWAATAAMSADCGGCIKIPVIVIDLPMSQLLTYGLNWTDSRGIPRAGVAAASKITKQAAGMSPAFFTMDGVSTFAAKIPVTNPVKPGTAMPIFATDAEDGITDEDVANLPHGDGSAFKDEGAAAPAEQPMTVVYGWGPSAEFMNPWHDEIGRFAPKGTGTRYHEGQAVPKIERDANGDIIVSEEAKALAGPIHEQAVAHEQEITKRLSQLIGDTDPAVYDPDAPPPPQLYGYKYRFKGAEGIAEKIERVVEEKGWSREKAAKDIKDSLRYTVHFTQEEFGPRSQEIINQLADENPSGKVKNTWPPSRDNPYKGVNVNVTANDGFTYEIQFHTPESQAIKDQQHEIYKNVRALPESDPRKAAAHGQMMELAASLQEAPPTGAVEVTTPARWKRNKGVTASAAPAPQWRLE